MEAVKLYNLSSNFALVLDKQATIIQVLPSDSKPLGFTKKRFLNKAFDSFLAGEIKEKFIKSLKKIKLNDSSSFEYEFITKSGIASWYKVSIVHKPEENNEKFLAYFSNINELKKQLIKSNETINELKYANALNNEIIHSTQAIILRLDIYNNVVAISKGAEKILGYTDDELVSKNWFKKIVPSHRYPKYESEYTNFLLSTKKVRVVTAPVLTKSKIEKIISWKTSKIIIDGVLVGTVAIGKDVTEITQKVKQLQESEKRFKELAQLVPTPISFITTKGEIIFLNKAYSEVFGYVLKDIPTVETLFEISYPSAKERRDAFSNWKQDLFLLKKGGSIHSRRQVVYYKKGQKRIMEYSATMSQSFIYYAYLDITAQIEKEALLLQNKEAFKRIAENTPVAIAGCDVATFKVIFTNKHFVEVLGYTQDDINEMDDWGNIIFYSSEEEKKQSLEIWQQVKEELFTRKSSVIKNLERKILCKNGKIKDIEVAVTFDNNTIYALFYDITERKIAENRLKESESRFRNLAEQLPTPLSCKTVNDKIVYVNDAYIAQFGYTTDDIPDFKSWLQKAYRTKEDRQNAYKTWKDDVALLQAGKPTTVKLLEIYNKAGLKRIVEHRTTLSGQYIYCSYNDITERLEAENLLKASESRFRNLAEQMSFPVSFVTIDGNFIFLNQAFTNKFGYTLEDFKNIKSVVNSTNLDPELKKIGIAKWENEVKTLFKNKTSITNSIDVHTKFGDLRQVEYSASLSDGFVFYVYSDITEQKKAENELRESEERFRNLAENLPVPVISLHAEKGLVFSNQKHKELIGYNNETVKKPTSFTKHIVKSKFNPAATQNFLNSLRILRNNKETKSIVLPTNEMDIRCQDGVTRTFQIGETIFGKTLYAIFHDITEQRKAENQLLESEAKFRNIVENLPVPLISLNPVTNALFANKKHKELIGHNNSNNTQSDDIAEHSIDDLVDEDSKKHFQDLIKRIKNNNTEKPLVEAPYLAKIVCKDKLTRTFEITETIFGRTLYSIFHDITEQEKASELLRESEAKFKALAENMPISIGAYDAKGKVVFINNFLTTTTGYTIKDLPTIRDWYKQTQPNITRRIEFYNYWIKTVADFRAGRLLVKPEIKASSRCKDGSFKYFTYSFSIHNDITYILIIDITEQEKAKKQLEKSHYELRSLASHLQNIREEERKFVAREIHDELGQQLTGIKMDVSAIFKKIMQENTSQESEFKQVLDMLNLSVKTVRKISSQLRPSVLDDLGLSAAIEWQAQEFSKRTSVSCVFTNRLTSETIDAEIQSNLFRILQESLTNIMRHASAKNVLIDLYNVDNSICLTIKDDGKGFNQKLSKPTLGLLGMKERALMIKGIFSIESSKGKGSVVKISVPN